MKEGFSSNNEAEGGDLFDNVFNPDTWAENPHENIYKEPNPEEEKLNRIYFYIQMLYYKTMFGVNNHWFGNWFGYDGTIGFKIPKELFNFSEPSLQKILSLLNKDIVAKRKNLSQMKEVLAIVINSLEDFDPDKEIVEDSRKDYIESGSAEFLKSIIATLKALMIELDS